jgi:hypothetical protein
LGTARSNYGAPEVEHIRKRVLKVNSLNVCSNRTFDGFKFAQKLWALAILPRLLAIEFLFAVALSLGTTWAFASTGSTASDVLTPQQFGAKGDGISDDWWAFQQAIDAAAARTDGGTVLVSDPPAGPNWRLSQALRMRSRVTLRVPGNSTQIRCTGDADTSGAFDPTQGRAASLRQWPTYSCVMFGSYESNDYMQLPIDVAQSVFAGAHEVILVSLEAVSRYKAGDVIVIESTSHFDVGKEHLKPTWLQIDRVNDVDALGRRLFLKYPLQVSANAVQVRRLTNTGLHMLNAADSDTNVPMWASFDAAVVGGSWDAVQSHAPFMGGGGALDCKLQPYSVNAYTGVGYGNLLARCNLGADEEKIRGVALELALGSHDNMVTLNRVEIAKVLGDPLPLKWLFGFNEGAHNNTVHIDTIAIGSITVEDVILMDRAFDNRIEVNSVTGASIAGSIVNIRSWNYAGTPPSTADNSIDVKISTLVSQRAYVTIQGRDTIRNHVLTGTFSGAVQNQDAKGFYFIGAGGGNVVERANRSAIGPKQGE